MFETFERVSQEDVESCRIVPRTEITNYEELVDNMFNLELQYNFWKNQYERLEVELWLETDWEEVFPNKKPTVKDKEMWIKQQLLNVKELRDTAKLSFDDMARVYAVAMKYGLEVLADVEMGL